MARVWRSNRDFAEFGKCPIEEDFGEDLRGEPRKDLPGGIKRPPSGYDDFADTEMIRNLISE